MPLSNWPADKSVKAFSWLMIIVTPPTVCECYDPWTDGHGLDKITKWVSHRKKSVSNILPLQFLSLDLYSEFLSWPSFTKGCMLILKKPFPHHITFGHGLYHGKRKQPKTSFFSDVSVEMTYFNGRVPNRIYLLKDHLHHQIMFTTE